MPCCGKLDMPITKSSWGRSSFASETLMAMPDMKVSEANELRPPKDFVWGHIKLATDRHIKT